MTEADTDVRRIQLSERFTEVRDLTEALALPLSPEDQTIQSMPDVSPTKWHRGHTSWFFETFLLQTELPASRPADPGFAYLFNSYYEGVGARHERAARGHISRPGSAAVGVYRRHIDEQMASLLGKEAPSRELLDLVELGIHHEQQHQELLLMDILHVLSRNPLDPPYDLACAPQSHEADSEVQKVGWLEHDGGSVEIGHRGDGFAFDNESPRHAVQLAPFAIADRLVTNADWLAFIDDGGYERPELWLSDGLAAVRQESWRAPLYWTPGENETWRTFDLSGLHAVVAAAPVSHVSYFEADAFARWADARLPTEAEWEHAAGTSGPGAGGRPDRFLDRAVLRPLPSSPGSPAFFGDLWEWTSSSYSPYPGFRPAPGAVGEYNGKFMVNQYVLRGGSCVTPPGHARATYRNFFPAAARWAFSGLRLARDL